MSDERLLWYLQDELYYLVNQYLNDPETQAPQRRLANLAWLRKALRIRLAQQITKAQDFEDLPVSIAAHYRVLWARLTGRGIRRMTVPISRFDPATFRAPVRQRGLSWA